MTRPYVRKVATQPSEQACPDCEGAGIVQDQDFDEHGSHFVNVKCEGCDGCCVLRDCQRCDEPTPPTVLDTTGGYCVACVLEMDVEDAASERARVRRAS